MRSEDGGSNWAPVALPLREGERPTLWDITFSDASNGWVVGERGSLTLRWDVAFDLNRVRYALYYRTTPFDFATDPWLASFPGTSRRAPARSCRSWRPSRIGSR